MKKLKGRSLIALSLGFFCILGVFQVAFSAQPDYPDKDITFIVPVRSGGSYDTTVRILAPYLQKYLPKKVNFIVQNKPGASFDIGITKLWRSDPDGYTIGIFNLPGNAVNQVMGKAKWDLTKFTWIGNVTSTPQMGALSEKSKYRTFEELLKSKEEFKVGTVGINSVAGLASAVTAKKLGLRIKPVVHEGGKAAVTAALRGDVDYVQLAYPILIRYAGKGITPIVVFDDEPSLDLPNVPIITQFTSPDILKVAISRFAVAGPPNMPQAQAKVLRDAFNKSVRDPEFIGKIEKLTKYRIKPVDYLGLEKIVKDSLDEVGKYKDLILKYSR